MKKLAIALVLSQAFVVSAFAQATRAEVKAEAASAVKSGKVEKGEASALPVPKSTKTRAQVKAERDASPKPEKGEASVLPVPKSTKARAEVKAEAAAAVKAGKIEKGEGTVDPVKK